MSQMEGKTALRLSMGFMWFAVVRIHSQPGAGRRVLLEAGLPFSGPRVTLAFDPDTGLEFTVVDLAGSRFTSGAVAPVHVLEKSIAIFCGLRQQPPPAAPFVVLLINNELRAQAECPGGDWGGEIEVLNSVGADITCERAAKFTMAELAQYNSTPSAQELDALWKYAQERYAL